MKLSAVTLRVCFPYASGGVADDLIRFEQMEPFSLRKWGCCRIICSFFSLLKVFPTQVGVLPVLQKRIIKPASFPYASGGVAD